MASGGEAVKREGGVLLNDAESKELENLLASVVCKRKTVPAKCMKLYKDIIRYEIKRLENAKIKLEESEEKQKFIKLVHKLRRSKPAQISFDDLNEAEKKVLKCHKRLKEINLYLKKRKQYIK